MRLLLGGTLHVVVILLAAATNVEGRRHKLTAGGRKWERRYRLKQKPNRALSAHKPLKAVYPAGVAVRFPGEFEPVASVTVAYDSWGGDIERIAAALINETDVDIFMLDWPQQFVTDQIQNAEQVKLIPHDVDALWTRDYGPVGVLLSADSSEEESLAIVDMEYIKTRQKDDAIPCSLAELYADWSPCYRMEVEMDGGNLMGDGYGNLFMTSATYDWNPDLTVDEVHENFKRFFGVHTIHVFEYAKDDEGFPLDGTGHIDSTYLFAIIARVPTRAYLVVDFSDGEIVGSMHIDSCGNGRTRVSSCNRENCSILRKLNMPRRPRVRYLSCSWMVRA